MLIYALVYVTRDEPTTPRIFTTWNATELGADPATDKSVNQCAAECLREDEVQAVRLVPITLSDGPLLAALGAVAPMVPGRSGPAVTVDLSGDPDGQRVRLERWPAPHYAGSAERDQLVRLRYLGDDGWGGYLRCEVYAVAAHVDRFGGITITSPGHHTYATVEAFWRAWATVA